MSTKKCRSSRPADPDIQVGCLGNDKVPNNIFLNSRVKDFGQTVTILWLMTSSGEEKKKTCSVFGLKWEET